MNFLEKKLICDKIQSIQNFVGDQFGPKQIKLHTKPKLGFGKYPFILLTNTNKKN